MKLGTITSRRVIIEREKAMEGARNPGFSKFGDCLVSINSKNDTVLTSNLKKINSEIRRMQLQINHKMKYFIKNSAVLNHDPIILVERPPSPGVVKRADIMMNYVGDEDVPGDENKPRYMRQIRSKARTPSTLTTIDAFTVKQKKKQNIWEGAVGEPSERQFQSTVRPYTKLTRREKSDLQKGYEFHKPKLENSGLSNADGSDMNKSHAHKKRVTEAVSDEHGAYYIDDEMTPFITQMASARAKLHDGKQKTVPEISFGPIGSKESSGHANQVAPVGRMVRFMSAPKDRRIDRKLKTKETNITF